MDARNSFKNKILWKRLSKRLKRANPFFFLRTQSLLVGKFIKNKKSLEVVISHSSGYKTNSQKFIY